MNKYIAFEIRRGDEDSAKPINLKFEVLVKDIEGDKLKFKLRFENPTMVSQGSYSDILVATILDESFFCSEDSAETIPMGTEIITVLPQLF